MNRFLVVFGIAASFVLAACGSSATAANGSASPSPGAGNGFRNGAAGQLVQINGQSLILSAATGDVTVSYTSSTTITKTSTATLADVTPGICIVATGQKDASGTITATTVRLAPKTAAGCSAGGFRGNPSPGASPRPTPSGQVPANFITGEVTAVTGVSVTVLTLANTHVSLTVPTTAAVSLSSVVNAAALQVGECLRANGPRSAAGIVQATALTITPPSASGTCSTGLGGPGRPSTGGAAPAAG
jgi:hypothetical protein